MIAKKPIYIDLKFLNKSKLAYKFLNNKRVVSSNAILYEIINDLKLSDSFNYQLCIDTDKRISGALKKNLEKIQDVFNRFKNSNYILEKFSENLRWLEFQKRKCE